MERPRNLLLISADSLRVDRLAVFRTGGLELDALDRLAARGVTYRRAQSVTPWTAPAMVSVFTGLYPPSHGVQVR
ncbi:MAG: alkaline phosphatase family protein, partial [Acidobacteriota bacterium]